MAEVVGLVASVVQLAGAGLKLSQTLYQYADGVASADRRIKDIANEVKLTSFVIQELGTIFEKDETANLISENAVRTANETIKECFAVFTELELKINKGKPGKMGRLMLPFKDNKIELLRSQIDKLKSTLELLMQVLIHAHQVSSEKYNREAEARHREEIKQLLENKKQATKKYEESLRNFSISDGSTAVDDGDRSVKDEEDIGSPSNLINAAGAIGSTINSDTLATCVDHVRSLLADIETLQLVLARKVDGDDHSDHHQKAIGSYFIARSHLDSVLFGNAQANTSVSTATHSKPPNGHVSGALSDERVQEEMKMKMEMEHERARTFAEERMKPESFQRSAEASLYDKERESALLIEREMRLEREARDEVRAKMEREGKVQDLVCRPAAHEDSIEDIPREFPSGAEYRQTKYREEYAPTLRRTSTRTNPETDETSDGRLVIEVPDRIDRPGATRSQLQLNNESSRADDAHHLPLSQAKPTKLEARARGERLWQEELRRRESSSAPARVKSTKRRDSRPPALSQPSQSARDKFPSSSPGYLSEEIEGSSYAPSTRIREAKWRPRKDKNEIDQNESQVSYSRQDDSFRTHNPRQILSPQLSLAYSDGTDKEVNGQLGAQVKPDGEEKRRGESGTDYLTKARVAEREKARAEETERRRRRRSEQEQMQQEFWWFSYNMESTFTPSDAYVT
ncbi:hypothetical protein BKA58DRAFT_118556 [Alternaria rosae]|uniref:uncharacterized protein n=1 Tax=Alternaria rosae TaxID=1187941 RepID=UPI001E8E585B|nr:uncharacterized protein BKA58DRAFT_118556 [Alternaria rosae]KAH6875288.1 hypothetical protein BKA58DRAFT_118556 [Alternaria rosae]